MKITLVMYLEVLVLVLLSFPFHISFLKAQEKIEFPKAVIVTDPADKQKIRGYTHLAIVWGEQLRPTSLYPRALINLKDAMNRWTDVYTTLDTHLKLDSERLLTMPFIFLTTDEAFKLTPLELDNVKKYLENGGFIVFDNGTPTNSVGPAEKSFKQMIRNALGAEAQFTFISDNHPLYHSFFDFDDGPPPGITQGFANPASLEGVWFKDRLITIYSNSGYVGKWNEVDGNTLQLKMGINMVIFALTQKGSLVQKE